MSLSGYRERERELDGGGGGKSVKYEVGTSKRFRRDDYVRVVLLCENADSGSAKRQSTLCARAHVHALTNYGSWRSRTVDWRFERAVKTFSNRQEIQNGLAPPSLERAAADPRGDES